MSCKDAVAWAQTHERLQQQDASWEAGQQPELEVTVQVTAGQMQAAQRPQKARATSLPKCSKARRRG